MNDKFNKLLFLSITFLTIILLGLFIFLKKETYSFEENRYLASFNIKELDTYLSDHFPMRNLFISLKNRAEIASGKTYINEVYLAKDDYLVPNFFVNEKKDLLINVINNFAEKYPLDVMIVPDSLVINKNKLKNHLPLTEEDELDYFYNHLHNTNNIVITEDLKKANEEKDVFYKTDHHWTSYGAYIAYTKYLENKGIMPLKESDFNIRSVTNDFLGTTSSKVLGVAQKESIEIYETKASLTVEYVLENVKTNSLYNFAYLNEKDKYSMFLDNNHALIKITNNDIESDSSILIVKNSFANSFAPFIVNNFKTTYLIDIRYYPNNISDFIEENHITNTLILLNLNNMYADMSLIKLK